MQTLSLQIGTDTGYGSPGARAPVQLQFYSPLSPTAASRCRVSPPALHPTVRKPRHEPRARAVERAIRGKKYTTERSYGACAARAQRATPTL